MTAWRTTETLVVNRTGESPFTVTELMSMPLMRTAGWLACERNGHRPIARVNAAEQLVSIGNADAGDLWIVSDFAFASSSGEMKRILPELAKREIAAIAILRLGSCSKIPSEAIEESERCGLVLLEFPGEIGLPEIATSVMERVVSQGNERIAELNGRLKKMTELLLEGGGLHEILDAMEAMLGNPVAVVRQREKSWFSRSLRGTESTDARRLLQSLTFGLSDRGGCEGFVQLPNSGRAYVRPLPGQKTKQAHLVAVELNHQITSLDALGVDRLASLIGLDFANIDAVREVEDKYTDRFLQDWLTGKIVAEADWKRRAEVCGFRIEEGASLVAILIGLPDDGSADRLREAARLLRSERGRTSEKWLAVPVEGELAVILSIPRVGMEGNDSEIGMSDSRNELSGGQLKEMAHVLRGSLGETGLKVYAGRIVRRPIDLPGSWSQAKYARQVAEVCGMAGETIAYDNLGVYSLLYLIPVGDERDQFLSRYSAPLRLADRKGGGRLMETLEMFFRCNGNIKLTSESLFAHYNTVVYRLEKVQAILGVSLDDPEERLQIQLALKLGLFVPNDSLV